VEGQAEAIHRALELSERERRHRLTAIRAHVREHDINAWLERQLAALESTAAPAR
jgi:trehalose-6-phosphate synthase